MSGSIVFKLGYYRVVMVDANLYRVYGYQDSLCSLSESPVYHTNCLKDACIYVQEAVKKYV